MLTLALGSANSRLTTHCRETLALSAIGILTRLGCYYHRDLQSLHGPQELTPLLLPMRDALLPEYNYLYGIGTWLKTRPSSGP
jgi:hypothetical protein